MHHDHLERLRIRTGWRRVFGGIGGLDLEICVDREQHARDIVAHTRVGREYQDARREIGRRVRIAAIVSVDRIGSQKFCVQQTARLDRSERRNDLFARREHHRLMKLLGVAEIDREFRRMRPRGEVANDCAAAGRAGDTGIERHDRNV